VGDILIGTPMFKTWLKAGFTQKFSVREKTIETQPHSISVIPDVSLQKHSHVSVTGSKEGHQHLAKAIVILSCCY